MAEAEGRKEQRGTECLGKLDAPPGHFSPTKKLATIIVLLSAKSRVGRGSV